jgi:hypothetical protein
VTAPEASQIFCRIMLPVAIAVLRQQTMGVIDCGATEASVVVMAVRRLRLGQPDAESDAGVATRHSWMSSR